MSTAADILLEVKDLDVARVCQLGSVSQLRKKCITLDVPVESIDAAYDEVNIKEGLATLLVDACKNRQHEEDEITTQIDSLKVKIMAKCASVKLSELKRLALHEGCQSEAVEECDDQDDIRAALTELLVEPSLLRKQVMDTRHAEQKRKDEIKEFSKFKISELKDKVVAAGFSDEEINAAYDDDDIKTALATLLISNSKPRTLDIPVHKKSGSNRVNVLSESTGSGESPAKKIKTMCAETGSQSLRKAPLDSVNASRTVISFNDATPEMRDFGVEGRLSFISIGDTTKKTNEVKRILNFTEEGSSAFEVVVLGQDNFAACNRLLYGRKYSLFGGRVSTQDGRKSLLFYKGTHIKIRDNGDDYVCQDERLSSLSEAGESNSGAKYVLVLHTLKVYKKDSLDTTGAMRFVQEVYVEDQYRTKKIVQLINNACSTMQENCFYLVKGLSKHADQLRIWGSAMVIEAPDEFKFAV